MDANMDCLCTLRNGYGPSNFFSIFIGIITAVYIDVTINGSYIASFDLTCDTAFVSPMLVLHHSVDQLTSLLQILN
ncbi:hypothetical protein PIROE2DRAFT_9716 [Piromyces sp. E2]|nr:hypothetical protein PIROE2DRAFT_9716 [Piromyces sp. E2]|eukprot:OUM63706.1 hypothetical protein PIROE2DRAFT_9716 [Piromyces sp. E2]